MGPKCYLTLVNKLFVVISCLFLINCFNIVYAETAIETTKRYYEAYAGDTVEVSWKTKVPMTDFEFCKDKNCTAALYNVYNNSEISRNKIYFVQITSDINKTIIPSETVIAKTSKTIPLTYNNFENMENDISLFIPVEIKYVTIEGRQQADLQSVKINVLEYKNGDINRDHDVNFFDIEELISLIYDNPGMYEWKDSIRKAAMFGQTGIPDFYTVISMISYVYH